jgi:trans-aconitate methyltransferase
MAKHSTDYHDYVFLDGELVGEFEEMYQHSALVPWHQDEQADWIDVRLTKELLSDIGPFDEIHDFGCGLGNYLGLIRERLGATVCQCFGYDISVTACIKAKQQFPDFQFVQLDLTLTSQPVTRNP